MGGIFEVTEVSYFYIDAVVFLINRWTNVINLHPHSPDEADDFEV